MSSRSTSLLSGSPTAHRSRQGTSTALERLAGFIVLGGSTRPNPLAVSTNRAPLDLPVKPGRRLIDLWGDQARTLADAIGRASLSVRVRLAQSTPDVPSPGESGPIQWFIERDSLDYRGTAGVLHDICRGYSDDDVVLVASAAQILVEPLSELALELASFDSDVSLLAHADGTPSGLMLVRCGCLRDIPEIGYIDFKEMALPDIATRHRVEVLNRQRSTSLPMRTVEDYLRSLRTYHLGLNGSEHDTTPFVETWQSTFALVEDGAVVDPSCLLHDSVVLRGGRVESGAVLVRCVVRSRGVVRRRPTLVDRVVSTVV